MINPFGETELLGLVENAIDHAFTRDKYLFKMYDYLKLNKFTKSEVQKFTESPSAANITNAIYDLEEYLEGGSDKDHQFLREAYGHLGKPRARKIKDYLYGMLEDCWRYSEERKSGRKKKIQKES